ncbi:MAG: thiolase family protein [Deltaproteobacteria bacterium]|nr:thiolase family protein [Deltaproteobacteria bacterium]
MGRRVAIVVTGQTPYTKRRKDVSMPELVHEAAKKALEDAELTIEDIDAVIFGTAPEAFEGVNCPDKWAADGVGALNKPFMRINTGGATGGSAALAGVTHVSSGQFDKVLVVASQRVGQTPNAQKILGLIWDPVFATGLSLNLITTVAMATAALMEGYGLSERHMAKISVKDHLNALNNPYAHVRKQVDIDDVLDSMTLIWPIKLFDCCPSSDGACAVIFAAGEEATKITPTPAWVIGTGATSLVSSQGEVSADTGGIGQLAFERAYKMAGIDNPRKQIDVVESYSPFSTAEISNYVEMGFAETMTDAIKLVEEGFGEMTGEVPFNPSGGVLCANPIGATALVRVAETALQVMGKAEKRQVPDVKVALAQGLGGSPGPGSATFTNCMVLSKKPL